MSDYDDFEDQRIKHLEFIQAVVGRLGNDAFLMKGWALTVAGAFIGFGVNSHNWRLPLASVVPTVTFWGLDAYFLRCERLFRRLYAKVRRKDTDVVPFYMDATSPEFITSLPPKDDVGSWWKALRRHTLWPFYTAILVAAGLAIWIILATKEPQAVTHLPHPHAIL